MANETKHTPEPWIWSNVEQHYGSALIRHKGKIICECLPEDARLIASAPELLEALREAENALEACGLHLHDTDKHDAGNGAYAVAVRARAAIAKAESRGQAR